MFFIFFIVHLIPGNSINTYTNATSVELNCDMAGYVPPDSYLRWYHNNNLIEDTYKYSTIYRPGRYRAQKGGNTTSKSVLSTLIIRSPTLNDTGKYECRVHDYNLTATVQLNVTVYSTVNTNTAAALSYTPSPTIYSTVSTNTVLSYTPSPTIYSTVNTATNTALPYIIAISIVSIMLVLVSLVLILICTCILVYCTHVSKRKTSSGDNIVTSANVVYGVRDTTINEAYGVPSSRSVIYDKVD